MKTFSKGRNTITKFIDFNETKFRKFYDFFEKKMGLKTKITQSNKKVLKKLGNLIRKHTKKRQKIEEESCGRSSSTCRDYFSVGRGPDYSWD